MTAADDPAVATADVGGSGPGDVEPGIAVIGPGRVGTALALALTVAGHRVVAVAGRGHAAIERFVGIVGDVRPGDPVDAARAAGLVLLTVGDDELPGLTRTLARDDAVVPGSRFIHTSGRHGAAVLRPLALAGGRVAACHPAQTFAAAQYDAGLVGCAWAVTAAPADLAWARSFVRLLDGEPVEIPETARTRYHAALTIGSNGTAAVVSLARDLLLASGVEQPERFLTALVTRSAANAAHAGAAALTGPVRRGDAATVTAHLDDLEVALPEALPAYRALAELALSYARRAGLDDDRARLIREVLDSGARVRPPRAGARSSGVPRDDPS